MNNKELVCKSIQIIREMFQARDLPEIAASLECYGDQEIENILKSKNHFNIDVDETLRIVFYLQSRFKSSDVKTRYFDNEDFEHYILVLKEKNPTSVKSLSKDNLQIFDLKDLQFNISTHHLVPKHRLIRNQPEIDRIYNELIINSRTKLPSILKTDPQAKFLNAKPGDLIEVTRYSPTSGEHIFYRICV